MDDNRCYCGLDFEKEEPNAREIIIKYYRDLLRKESQPVEDFYRSRGKLMEFELPGGIPESWPKLLQALNLEDHDEKQSAVA